MDKFQLMWYLWDFKPNGILVAFIHLNFSQSNSNRRIDVFDNDSSLTQQLTTRWSLSQEFDKPKITFVPSPQHTIILNALVCVCGWCSSANLPVSIHHWIYACCECVQVCAHIVLITLTTSRPNSWKEEEQKKENHTESSVVMKKRYGTEAQTAVKHTDTHIVWGERLSEWVERLYASWMKSSNRKEFLFLFSTVL